MASTSLQYFVQALKDLVNISGQRVVEIFNQLERRLKLVDKSSQLDMRSEGGDGGRSKQKQKKKSKLYQH